MSVPKPTTASVSVVIATYNRGLRIQRTLDSVRQQSELPGEIVVVDDASPDRTGAWVKEHYPDVRVVISERNGGTSVARNRGAREATGDVLVFLDHDDELLPHALATLVELLAVFPEARAAFADHSFHNLVSGVEYANHHTDQPAFARLREIPVARQLPQGRLYDGQAMYHALLHGNLLQQPWAVYRSTFDELGGFNASVRYCEDWDLYLRVSYAVPLALSDAVISRHWLEGANLSSMEGQDEMHRQVLRWQLDHRRWDECRARNVLRRRLGMAYKVCGDRERPHSLPRAWKWYARSFLAWPFDHVVAARTLFWPFRILGGKL
jgi:glycosyltransferase involved in cell wall biosynthesis